VFRSFYLSSHWLPWAFPGAGLILFATWYKVELDVKINDWFGDFYNLIQKTLGKPGATTLDEYMEQLATFGYIAGLYVTVAVFTDFFIKHYVFRWRTAMTDYYAANWHTVRGIEGASQRVQEDTMRFARLMEGLGVSFMRSVMTLFAFLPILRALSEKITEFPWIGSVPRSLVWVAIAFALAGTVLMAVVGIKLPGLEFENQRVEAAFRKELVYGEDDWTRATTERSSALFGDVRRNYFRLFFHYMYFDVARYSYLQFGVLVRNCSPCLGECAHG
jgi:peptide/bleomycin uptake transporter